MSMAERAEAHLGEHGPVNTCWSNGPERWAEELGLPGLDTASVSVAEQRARAGRAGWRYHDGTDGLRRGHIADWRSENLGGPGERHVTAVVEVAEGRWRGIGSGTPSGTVARQPSSGGWNPLTILRGYFVPPAKQTPQPAPQRPSSESEGSVYVVKRGDSLSVIAGRHGTTVKALLRANPARPDRRSADFHVAQANLIVVGQKLRLP